MAGARSLWRANGMREEQFGRPIIGIANSFTQLVPGHVHLHEIGQQVKQRIEACGCFAAEFDTIAVDDGIAMGHDGMLYSLPSREIIADSVEYMANAHCIDALVCISNCDKITPGMLMAAMRLNIPTVFVSGGPMEAGRFGDRDVDLIDAMVMGADDRCSDEEAARIERCACPGCGSCSGMFTANSMNCLTEALGLSLPGNGTIVATHVARRRLFEEAAALVVRNAERYYFEGDDSLLPCCTCWPWPTRRAWTSRCTTSTASRARYPCCARSHPTRTTIFRMSTAPEASSRSWENSTARNSSTPPCGGSTAARWARRSPPATCAARRWATTPSAAGEAPPPARATGSWAYRTPATKRSTPTARRAASATRSTPISATEGWPC